VDQVDSGGVVVDLTGLTGTPSAPKQQRQLAATTATTTTTTTTAAAAAAAPASPHTARQNKAKTETPARRTVPVAPTTDTVRTAATTTTGATAAGAAGAEGRGEASNQYVESQSSYQEPLSQLPIVMINDNATTTNEMVRVDRHSSTRGNNPAAISMSPGMKVVSHRVLSSPMYF
jgi:hypothetical protein